MRVTTKRVIAASAIVIFGGWFGWDVWVHEPAPDYVTCDPAGADDLEALRSNYDRWEIVTHSYGMYDPTSTKKEATSDCFRDGIERGQAAAACLIAQEVFNSDSHAVVHLESGNIELPEYFEISFYDTTGEMKRLYITDIVGPGCSLGL